MIRTLKAMALDYHSCPFRFRNIIDLISLIYDYEILFCL